jgi:predicted DNA-binding transcriptional regulator YafY
VLAAKVQAEHPRAHVLERRGDGSVVIELAVSNRPAFRSWLLGLLDHGRVLAPDELRDDVRSWLVAIAEGGR